MDEILSSCNTNQSNLPTLLLNAVYNDQYDKAYMLVDDFWVDANTWDNDGYTAIWYAAYNGNIKMIILLLEFGGDPTISSFDGLKPLDVAIQTNNREMTTFLHHVERVWHSILAKPKYFEDSEYSESSYSQLCLPDFEKKVESYPQKENYHKTRSRSSASNKAIRSRDSKERNGKCIDPYMIRKKQRIKSLKKKERKSANFKY
jgi:hypothetical protein